MFDVDLAGRVLPFDIKGARVYPAIATIVRSRGARLATRNVRDFVDSRVTVIDLSGEA